MDAKLELRSGRKIICNINEIQSRELGLFIDFILKYVSKLKILSYDLIFQVAIKVKLVLHYKTNDCGFDTHSSVGMLNYLC